MLNCRNTLASKSEELFGERHVLFCETISTAILGKKANKICDKYCEFDDEWFSRYYPELDKFDYIVLIARKGYSLFRSYLRTIKEDIEDNEKKEAFSSNAKKTIVLNTRTSCFYTFDKGIGFSEPKSISKAKVLVLDDLLNKGRNVSRIADNLLRLGIKSENIYYSALGYYAIQKRKPEEDDFHTTWITSGKNENKPDWYWLNFHEKANGGELAKKGVRIRLFLPYSLADESFFSSRDFFVDKKAANKRMFDFNTFLHYSLIPYTDYTTSAYFNYNNEDQDPNNLSYNKYAKKKLFDSDKLFYDGHQLNIRSCEKAGIDSRSLIINSNSKNGYYASFRVMHNPTRGELLFYPYVVFPAFNKSTLCLLYKRLFAGVENLDKINTMMAHIYPAVGETDVNIDNIKVNFVSFWEDYYVSDKLKRKNVYEHMARVVSCVISAIVSVRFIVDNSLFSDEKDECKDYAVTLFGKNLERFLGVKLIDDNKTFEEFLRKCLKNYEANLKLFEFKELIEVECPKIENLDAFYEAKSNVSKVRNLDNICEHVGEHLMANEKIEPYFYLLDVLKKISETDEFSSIKLPPIPTYRIIEIIKKCMRITNSFDAVEEKTCASSFCDKYGKSDIDETLFMVGMLALEAMAEDGILNSSLYAESPLKYSEREKFIIFSGLQCGEMAVLIGAIVMEVCGGWPIVAELQSIYLDSGSAEFPSELTDIVKEFFPENADIIKKKFEYVLGAESLFTYSLDYGDCYQFGYADAREYEKTRKFIDAVWRNKRRISMGN